MSMQTEGWREFTIPASGLNVDQLLAEWRWLVPKEMTATCLSLFGDWIFAGGDGRVYFLDSLEGTFQVIAPSMQGLFDLLQAVPGQKRWLMAEWVQVCHERGLLLERGQCYGWKIAPILGGKLEFPNIQVFDLLVYQCVTGQLLHQVKVMPKGYTITGFEVR